MAVLTDWIPGTVGPVHVGLYEVNMDTWPWPAMVEWTGAGWDTEIEVREWRGLTEPTEYITIED